MKKPSIIFIFADQMRTDCLSGFGHPVVKTPNLDALLADGVGFRRCVTQAPLCVPARMSLFTGRYVHQHGCVNNAMSLWPETDNLVRRMRDAGYLTGCRGKLHLFWRHDTELLMSEQLLECFGFEDGVETTGKASEGRLRASAYTEALKAEGMLRSHWKWLWEKVKDRTVGVSYGPSILDEALQQDGWILDRGHEWVNDHIGGDQPILAWIGPEGPHDPFDPPGAWAEMYKPEDVDLPLRRFSEDPDARKSAEKCRVDLASEDELRRMRAFYYGNISFIDHKIGELIQDLKTSGRYDDTWIVFGADHGEMLGDFNCTGKTVFHKQAIETPLIIKPPAALSGCPRGAVSDALVELIDVGTTFMEIAGAELAGDRGRSLLSMISGETPLTVHRDAVRSQVHDRHMLQTTERKLIYRTNDSRSLGDGYELLSFYNLEDDRQERHNLLPENRAEANAFFEQHEPAFYEQTDDCLPPQWPDVVPYRTWGRNPVLETL